MEGFKGFIANIGGVWAVILSGSALLPVLAVFSGVVPDGQYYPSALVAVASGFLVLLVVLNTWVFGQRLSQSTARAAFAILSLLALIVFGSYFYLLTRFELTASGETFIAGCDWTAFALSEARSDGVAVADQCPGDASFLLDDAAEPDEIWTEASIRQIELLLFGVWALFTMTWSALVAFFAIAFLKKDRRSPTTPDASADDVPRGSNHSPSQTNRSPGRRSVR